MSKAFILGFLIGLLLLIGGGVAASKLAPKAQDRDREAKRQARERERQAELADATPVELGMLSEKQRAHSRLYKHYAQMTGGRTVGGEMAKKPGKDIGVLVASPLQAAPVGDPPTVRQFLRRLANDSDSVVRGSVVGKTAQVTEDGAFIFTDYDVQVDEVFKDAGSRLFPGATVTVTRPGGLVEIGGAIARALDESYQPLPGGRGSVVLFLTYIPETNSYRATSPNGSFALEGGSLRPLTKSWLPEEVASVGAGTLLDVLRSVAE
jgi:hypothetical protein